MVQIDLITGILGSGKTTFILKYANYLIQKGEKVGILEYDYGAVNVDMMLLNQLRGEACELEMVAAGCDEDCLRRRFKSKLISMAMSGYTRVIVEPSGVFDMDMFFDSLREEPLENWYEIGNVITMVNANLKEDLSEEEDFFLASQAASAGCVVFSRVQLSTPEKIEETKAHIMKAAEKIRCKQVRALFLEKDWDLFGEEDFEKLYRSGYYVEDYVKSIVGTDLAFESVCVMERTDGLDETIKKVKELFADKTYGNIIRVKGFIYEGEKCYQMNASQYECFVDETKVGQNILIVIGTKLSQEKIKAYLA